MKIVFLVTAVINALVFIFALLKDIQFELEHKTLKKAFIEGTNLGKKIEEEIINESDRHIKIGKVIGTIIVMIIALLFIATFILPILLGFIFSFETAIIAYLILFTIFTLPRLVRLGRTEVVNEKVMILTSLVTLFKFQAIIILLFGFDFNLDSVILQIYNSNIFISNTLTIITPILFYSSIIISAYLYWKAMVVNSKLAEEKKKKMKLSDAIIVLVASSVIGLIHLFEMGIDTTDNIAFDRILDVFIVVLGSVLIPSLFAIFNKSKEKNNDLVKNDKDENEAVKWIE